MVRNVILSLFVLAAAVRPATAESVTETYQGLEVSANLKLAEGKTVSDGVILLLHGTLAHNKMEIIVAQQNLLADRGFSTLAPTLSLGVSKRTGMYDCKVTHTHRQADALDEIGLWLNWLKSQGAKTVTLAGHSRGGAEIAWFAATHDDPVVDKVVLVAPATWDAAHTASGFKATHKADLAGVLAKAKALVAAGKGDEVMKGVGLLYCPGADATAASFVGYYDGGPNFDTPSLLGKIKKPVLVAVGTLDTVVPDIAPRVRPMADGKKIKFVTVADADHFFADLYGEDLADAIAVFLKN